jgi:hypothetical protein
MMEMETEMQQSMSGWAAARVGTWLLMEGSRRTPQSVALWLHSHRFDHTLDMADYREITLKERL